MAKSIQIERILFFFFCFIPSTLVSSFQSICVYMFLLGFCLFMALRHTTNFIEAMYKTSNAGHTARHQRTHTTAVNLFSMYNINLITLLTNNFHFSSGHGLKCGSIYKVGQSRGKVTSEKINRAKRMEGKRKKEKEAG